MNEDEQEEQAGPRDQRTHAPGTRLARVGSEPLRPQSRPRGARSEPESPRVPRRYADDAVHGIDHVDEEAVAPELVKRGKACTYRFMGVSWNKVSRKWLASSKGTHLGLHTTEEAAARAYGKYLKDGSVPEPGAYGPAGASQFKGVSWNKRQSKWAATCKGTHLGVHATEAEAARACSKYLEDNVDLVAHRDAKTSQFMGVSWDKSSNKWAAKYKGTYLGLSTSEVAAARAYSKYLKDGVAPGRTATSQFTGVSWNRSKGKWQAHCQTRCLGSHSTEEAAAQAYNDEAKRVGRPLNVIPPAGAAGTDAGAGAVVCAGGGAAPRRVALMAPVTAATTKNMKRAAPETRAAPASSKNMKL